MGAVPEVGSAAESGAIRLDRLFAGCMVGWHLQPPCCPLHKLSSTAHLRAAAWPVISAHRQHLSDMVPPGVRGVEAVQPCLRAAGVVLIIRKASARHRFCAFLMLGGFKI